jgi:hypothetical protein
MISKMTLVAVTVVMMVVPIHAPASPKPLKVRPCQHEEEGKQEGHH